MYRTLLEIPHGVVEGMLVAWAVACVAILIWLVVRQGLGADTLSYLPVLGLTGLMIWVLRLLEQPNLQGAPVLPIRGYGVMFLAGVVAGCALAMRRARQMGLDPEIIITLAFWMVVAGIAGARGFYVVHNWGEYKSPIDVLKVWEGGLVAYGSLIGALLAAVVFVRRHGLPLLAMGDLIAPSMALGLAFGRIGCLLNGCCFGGICAHPWAVTFPEHSPPYQDQRQSGLLHGIRLGADSEGKPVVRDVFPNSAAAEQGLQPGDRIKAIDDQPAATLADARRLIRQAGWELVIHTHDGRRLDLSMARPPPRSHPVHPTQVYSAINALLLCLLLLAYYPFRRRDGEVIALVLTIYPITRYLLEIIRTDEQHTLLGLGLTISQLVSLLILLVAGGLWLYLRSRPLGSVWPPDSEPVQGTG